MQYIHEDKIATMGVELVVFTFKAHSRVCSPPHIPMEGYDNDMSHEKKKNHAWKRRFSDGILFLRLIVLPVLVSINCSVQYGVVGEEFDLQIPCGLYKYTNMYVLAEIYTSATLRYWNKNDTT